jgi:hypothetical protein
VEGASCAFRITADIEGDVRPALAAGLVAENLGVLELKRVDVSLEDIFVELTTSEEGGA